MTTKLIHKLSYLKTSTDMIKSALQEKGAIIDENTTLRQLPQLINELHPQEAKEFVLKAHEAKENEKVFIQKTFDKAGTHPHLMGSMKGYHIYSEGSIGFKRGDVLITTHLDTPGTDVRWNSYVFNKEDKTLTPQMRTTENAICGNFLSHPDNEDLLTTYSFNTSLPYYPKNSISYPTSDSNAYTSFSIEHLIWTPSGLYLAQVGVDNKNEADLMRLVYDSTTNTYSYTHLYRLMFTTTNTYHIAPGGIGAGHSFGAQGRYIYYLNESDDTIKRLDINTLSLPVSGASLLMFGNNYLILRQDETPAQEGESVVSHLYFIKAEPLDASPDSASEPFFKNPSAFSYQLIHTQLGQNVPQRPLTIHPDGFCSPLVSQKDYFIKPLKESITDMTDFIYRFGAEAEDLPFQNGVFVSDDIFLALFTDRTLAPRVCEREPLSHRFKPQNVIMTHLGTFLNEYGKAFFAVGGVLKQGVISDNKVVLSDKDTIPDLPAIFLKNGTLACSYNGYLFATTCLNAYQKILTINGMSAILDEDFVSDLYNNRLIYVADDATFTPMTIQNASFNNSSSLAVCYQGQYLAFDFQGQTGTDIKGSVYTLTPDTATQTVNATYLAEVNGSFSNTTFSTAQYVKGGDMLISKNGFIYAFYQDESNAFHFVEKELPPFVKEKMGTTTIYSLQTFYDGSVALQLSDCRTILFTPYFDKKTGLLSLKDGTTVSIYNPHNPKLGQNYKLFSPFKEYEFAMANDYSNYTYVDYMQQADEVYQIGETPILPKPAIHYPYKAEKADPTLFDSGTITAYATGQTKTDDNMTPLCEVVYKR